jgi:hypothetical protein
LFNGRIILCEAKDSAVKVNDDILKLNSTIDSEKWSGALWDAMEQRAMISKLGLPLRGEFIINRHALLRKALAIPHTPSYVPPPDFLLLETDESKTTIRAGPDFPDIEMLVALREHLA